MTAPESPDALLRRAADRLDELDKAAGAAPWAVDDEADDELRLVRGTALHGSGSYHCTDEIAAHDVGNYGDDDLTWREDPEYLEVRADFDVIATLRPVAAPLAAHLRATADRWGDGVILDRPEAPEMTPACPEAWWCEMCGGAIDSPDYPSDDAQCRCGVWTEALALARAVLAETES